MCCCSTIGSTGSSITGSTGSFVIQIFGLAPALALGFGFGLTY